jgi:hypothetical protein
MKRKAVVAAAGLFAATGQAWAQPVVDGSLAGDEAAYGGSAWTQNQPTSAGDNAPGSMSTCPGLTGLTFDEGFEADYYIQYTNGNTPVESFASTAQILTAGGGTGAFIGGSGPCAGGPLVILGSNGVNIATNNSNTAGVDGAAVNDAAAVTTGIEIEIPLSELGNPTGAIRVVAFVNGGGHDFLSNQVLGGLPLDTPNLGEPRNVNFSTIDGDQFFTVPAIGPDPAGPPVLDGTLDTIYGPARAVQTTWTQFGNSTNGDTCGAVGGSELDAAYGYVSFDGKLHLMLTGNMEANFNKLDIFIDSVGGGQNELRGDNPDVDFNGLNRMGGSADAVFTAGDEDFANGSEIDGVYGHVDEAGGFLYLLVTGNIQSSCVSTSDVDASNAVPKMHIFVDADADDGQNQILFNNPNISFNNFVGSMAGLTFDAGFTADYWAAVHTEFVPVLRAMDALRLRTGGEIIEDYGTYDKDSVRPVVFDGPQFDTFDAFIPDRFAQYPAQGIVDALHAWAAADPIRDLNFDIVTKAMLEDDNGTNHLAPIVGRVVFDLDNSNTGGVTAASAAGAATATTGWEIKLSLDEIGWDGVSPIKVAGFITNPNYSQILNQVIGGLPGAADVGAAATTDFNQFAGDQFVTVFTPGAQCACEFDGDAGQVNVFDLLAYLDLWFQDAAGADLDGDPGVDVFDLLFYLDCWFPASAGNPCP